MSFLCHHFLDSFCLTSTRFDWESEMSMVVEFVWILKKNEWGKRGGPEEINPQGGTKQNIVLSIAWGKLTLSYRNIQSSLTSSLNHCLVANHSMDFLNILWRIIWITAIKNIMWISTTCSCLYSQRGGVWKGWTKEVEYHCVELNKLYIT